MKRALLVYNPVARGAPSLDRLRAAIGRLADWETSLETTTAAGHATELARGGAKRGLDAVVACGGDGTVNEVANGLAGSPTALAVVRGGTANVWAKETRLPHDPAAAVRLLAEGETRSIDLGRVTALGDLGRASAIGGSASSGADRYFLLMAGIGLDAAVVHEVSSSLKQRFGAASYLLYGVRRALRYPSVDADLVVDGEPLASPLYWLLLGNTRNYAGLLNITHLAKADDGRLDMALLPRGGLLRLAWLAPWVLLGRHHQQHGGLRYRTVGTLEVRTPGLPVQIDGEYLTETPLRFEVAPAALRVLVPRDLQSPLFGGST